MVGLLTQLWMPELVRKNPAQKKTEKIIVCVCRGNYRQSRDRVLFLSTFCLSTIFAKLRYHLDETVSRRSTDLSSNFFFFEY